MSSPAGNSPSILEQVTCFSLGTRMVYFSRAPVVDSVGAIRIWPNAKEAKANVRAPPSRNPFMNRGCIWLSSSLRSRPPHYSNPACDHVVFQLPLRRWRISGASYPDLLAFAFALALVLSRLLPRQRGLEALLVLVDVSFVALGVDKRIRISRPALLKLFVLRGHALERRVRAEEHLHRERAGLLVGSPEVV